MPIFHKFLQTNFENGFQTHNAILDVTPYDPEVLFIGTNNPETPNANFADIFYGRNYFWPAITNIFTYNDVRLIKSRMPKKGKPTSLKPTKNEIFDLMIKLKLTFADLIIKTLNKADLNYKILDNDNVIYNEATYNLIQDQKNNKGILGLSELDNINQVEWNTNNIIEYLKKNPSIKSVYLTRQPTGVWAKHWEKIKIDTKLRERQFISIYTPSGQGGALHQQTNIYGKGKMIPLLSHWINGPNGKLDSNWLVTNGVCLEKFKN